MTEEKRYLEELGELLDYTIKQVTTLSDSDDNEKLLYELREISKKEAQLREDCDIGERFKVIQTQLQTVLKKFEIRFLEARKKSAISIEKENILAEDEELVYVYLFNAQGEKLKNWENLLLPSALFEHSVNRPIYSNVEHVKALIRAKQNISMHGFLEIAIKKNDILSGRGNDSLADKFGHKLLRVKQGSLKVEKIKKFIHKKDEYSVTKNGKLVK